MAARAAVVAEAADAWQAHMWVDALRRAGIEATTFERGAGAALGGAALPYLAVYPVVVGYDSLGAARRVIAKLAGQWGCRRTGDQAKVTRGDRPRSWRPCRARRADGSAGPGESA